LSEKWSKLEVIYRIPKKNESSNNYNNDGSLLAKKILDDRRSRSSETVSPSTGKIPTGPSPRLKLPWSDINIDSLPENRKMDGIPLPPGWEWAIDTNTKVKYFFNRARNVTQWQKPEWNIPDEEDIKRKRREREKERDKVKEMKNLRLLERQRALKRQTDLRLEEQRPMTTTVIIEKINFPESHCAIVPGRHRFPLLHHLNMISRLNADGLQICSVLETQFVSGGTLASLHCFSFLTASIGPFGLTHMCEIQTQLPAVNWIELNWTEFSSTFASSPAETRFSPGKEKTILLLGRYCNESRTC